MNGKSNLLVATGKEKKAEADEYKYLEAWINKHANRLNNVYHPRLCEKATVLHALATAAKFGKEKRTLRQEQLYERSYVDLYLAAVVRCGLCPSQDSERKLEQVQDRAGELSWGYCGNLQ